MAVFKLFPAMLPNEAAVINNQVVGRQRRTHGLIIKWNIVFNWACLIMCQPYDSAYIDKGWYGSVA